MPGRLEAPHLLSSDRRRGARAGAVFCAFLRRILAAGLPLILLPPLASAADGASCAERPTETGEVAAVSPAGDLVLADGTVLRLAGLAGGGAGADVAWRPALLRRVDGRTIAFVAVAERDRHGRRPAVARLQGEAETLQEALLREGVALVQPGDGAPDCRPAWREAEASARRDRRGLWRHLPLRAYDVGAIAAQEGRFTIVTGRVRDVGKTARVDYLNFGRVWRHDMTGRIGKPVRVALEARGLTPAMLAGRQVTLRGTVFEAGGPAMDIDRIEQIDWDEGLGPTGPAGDE